MATSVAPVEVSPAAPKSSNKSWVVGGILTALLVIRVLILPLTDSYWVDETLVSGLFGLDISGVYKGAAATCQSAIYSAFVRILYGMGLHSEFWLRLPSAIAVLGSMFLLYRTGMRASGQEAGLIAAALLFAHPETIRAGVQLRPYGIAVLMSTIALNRAWHWRDRGRTADGVIASMAAAFAFYLHAMFASGFPVLAVWALTGYKAGKIRIQQIVLAALAAIPILALGVHAWTVTVQTPPFAEPSTLLDLLAAVFLPSYLFGFGVTTVSRLAAGDNLSHRLTAPAERLWVLAAGAVIPPVGVYLGSFVLQREIFIPRFFLASAPYLALLCALLLMSLKSVRLRRMATIAAVFAMHHSTVGYGSHALYFNEDWRDGLAVSKQRMGPNTDLYLYSGLVESRITPWLIDSVHHRYFRSPAYAYLPEAEAAQSHIVPLDFDKEGLNFIKPQLDRTTAARHTVIFTGRELSNLKQWEGWLRPYMAQAGYAVPTKSEFGFVQVLIFSPRE